MGTIVIRHNGIAALDAAVSAARARYERFLKGHRP